MNAETLSVAFQTAADSISAPEPEQTPLTVASAAPDTQTTPFRGWCKTLTPSQ